MEERTGEDGHEINPDPDYVRATRMLEEAGQVLSRPEGEPGREATPPLPHLEQAPEVLQSAPAYYALWTMGPSGLGLAHDVAAQERLLGDFLAEAGSPTDPVERLLLQQLHLTFHAVGRLHVRAGAADDPQVIVAFLGAAARLLAELRKLALALEAYRTSSAARGEKKRATRRPAVAVNGSHEKHGRNGNGIHTDTELVSNNRLEAYLHALEPASP